MEILRRVIRLKKSAYKRALCALFSVFLVLTMVFPGEVAGCFCTRKCSQVLYDRLLCKHRQPKLE